MFKLFKRPGYSQWEYKIIPIGELDDPDSPFIENQLLMDALGQIGWELVTIYHNHMIFKRHATGNQPS